MNSYKTPENPWFKNGKCVIHPSREVCRKKFVLPDKTTEKKVPRDWITRMNRRSWLSTQLLRLYCARRYSFIALLLTPVVLLLIDLLVKHYRPNDYIDIWGDASAGFISVVVLFIVFIFIVAGKEVKKFEDSVRDIVEVCKLSPETFPKTSEKLHELIRECLIDRAWTVQWCDLKGKAKDGEKAVTKAELDKLYKAADALGVYVRSSYHYYYEEAKKKYTRSQKTRTATS